MHLMLRLLACLVLVCAAMGALVACGKEGAGGKGDDRGERSGEDEEQDLGSIRIGAASFPDALDPALAYTAESWQIVWNVYTPLLTYRHAEGEEGSQLIPGLAEELPGISADGRTYTLRLREDLRYSDGTPVRASDFEHTVKRALDLESGATPFFATIAGVDRYLEQDRARADIAGIRADDREREITITLKRPDGRFPSILAMSFGGLVPGDTPFGDQTADPPPGVGAFRIEDVRPGSGFELVRNPRFDVDDLPQAGVDEIAFTATGGREQLTRDVVANRVDLMLDPPVPDRIGELRERFGGGRYREAATISTYYYFLNHDLEPFDDVRVRRAANLAIDQRRVAGLFDGLLEPGCNLLPPGVPGHEPIARCPFGDPDGAAQLDRARALVRRAGAAGEEVVVYGSDEPRIRATAEYLVAVLGEIGLDARPRLLEAANYPPARRSLRAQAGVAAHFPDFPHPASHMSRVSGAAIRPDANPNLGAVQDPKIDAALARAGRNPDLDEVAADYAAIDRRVIDRAHVAPLGTRKLTALFSERMDTGEDCDVVHPLYGTDLASLCLE